MKAILGVSCVFGLLMYGLFASSSPAAVFAQSAEEPVNPQLTALNAGLQAIGEAIRNSPDISEPERLTLLSQLIVVSTQILELQKTLNAAPAPAPAQPDYVNATSTGLERIIVRPDVEEYEVDVELVYRSTSTGATSSVERSYTLTDPQLASFDEKVADIRKQMHTELSEDLGIVLRDIKDRTMVSVYNPARDEDIEPGSQEAIDLALNFGNHSIVNKVVVSPRDEYGSIDLYTDQDEVLFLRLNIHRESTDGLSDEALLDYVPEQITELTDEVMYDYNLNLYIPVPTTEDLDPLRNCSHDECPFTIGSRAVQPMVSQSEIQVERDEVDNVLATLSSGVPFATQLPNFEVRTLSFLLLNPTYTAPDPFGTGFAPDEPLECYSSTDKAVIREFVRSLLEATQVQYLPVNDIVYFDAPYRPRDESGRAADEVDFSQIPVNLVCEGETSFF